MALMFLASAFASARSWQQQQQSCAEWAESLSVAGERIISKRQMRLQGPLDHILEKVFERIGLTQKSAVEFGFQYMSAGSKLRGLQLLDRYSLNTYTMRKRGWNVTYFDAIISDAEANIIRAVLTEHNIAGHFQQAGVPVDADFVSIDVDSVDIWLLYGLLRGGYRPRVLAIEFNPNFASDQLVTFERVWHEWTGATAFGASAAAINQVGMMYGYTVVQMPFQKRMMKPSMKPGINVDMILVRSDLLQTCVQGSIPSFAHLARNLPQREHATCTSEDLTRLRDFPLALMGMEEAAKLAARKAVLHVNHIFPHNPVCHVP